MKKRLIIEGTQISKTEHRYEENNTKYRGKVQENEKTHREKTTEITYRIIGIPKEETRTNCIEKKHLKHKRRNLS